MIFKFYGGSLNGMARSLPSMQEFRQPIPNNCMQHIFTKYPERPLTYVYELYKRYDYDKMFFIRNEQNI